MSRLTVLHSCIKFPGFLWQKIAMTIASIDFVSSKNLVVQTVHLKILLTVNYSYLFQSRIKFQFLKKVRSRYDN